MSNDGACGYDLVLSLETREKGFFFRLRQGLFIDFLEWKCLRRESVLF